MIRGGAVLHLAQPEIPLLRIDRQLPGEDVLSLHLLQLWPSVARLDPFPDLEVILLALADRGSIAEYSFLCAIACSLDDVSSALGFPH